MNEVYVHGFSNKLKKEILVRRQYDTVGVWGKQSAAYFKSIARKYLTLWQMHSIT